MSAKIIDGKAVADKIKQEIKKEVEELFIKIKEKPGLAVVLVGDNPASMVYVSMKRKMCEEIGFNSFEYRYPKETKEGELLELIETLNNDDRVNGILVQLPLPSHIREEVVLSRINPDKDVDGFHPLNVGKLMAGMDTYYPCTPFGIHRLLIEYGYNPEGKHVVVVGRSNIVGKPIAMMLVQKKEFANATVTICHSKTKNLKDITRMADILIAAIGQPEFIKKDMIKEGSIVIDVGVNRVDDPNSKKGYKLVGDVAFNEVLEVASAITPVPGGVGPMTIIMLMHNTLKAFKKLKGLC